MKKKKINGQNFFENDQIESFSRISSRFCRLAGQAYLVRKWDVAELYNRIQIYTMIYDILPQATIKMNISSCLMFFSHCQKFFLVNLFVMLIYAHIHTHTQVKLVRGTQKRLNEVKNDQKIELKYLLYGIRLNCPREWYFMENISYK